MSLQAASNPSETTLGQRADAVTANQQDGDAPGPILVSEGAPLHFYPGEWEPQSGEIHFNDDQPSTAREVASSAAMESQGSVQGDYTTTASDYPTIHLEPAEQTESQTAGISHSESIEPPGGGLRTSSRQPGLDEVEEGEIPEDTTPVDTSQGRQHSPQSERHVS